MMGNCNQDWILIDTIIIMRLIVATLVLFLAVAALGSELDAGMLRLNRLLERSKQERNRIIPFNKQDFNEYVMKYPRPYDLVVFFTARSHRLCTQLFPEFEYMVDLYEGYGAIDTPTHPTFFATITHSQENQQIFQQFGFNTAPNIIVSKPHMAVVSDSERKLYYQQFQWSISSSDGQVETHKMLEFVNKRTGKDVIYKPTVLTMCKMFFGFIIVAVLGVLAYIRLKFLWNHWVFWLAGSLIIYITCCSGIIYDIIHDVPFTGRDQKTGETIIFSGGNREQYGLEGWIVSISITLVGLFFISIVLSGERLKEQYSALFGVVAIFLIYFVVTQLEKVYKEKGWYGPNFYPPDGYLTGPLSRDQGNNI